MNKNRVIFYVAGDTHILDIAGPVQVFYEAAEYGVPYEIIYISDQPTQQFSSGLKLFALQTFTSVDILESDIVFVPGFSLKSYNKHYNKPLLHWLQKVHTRGAAVCSVCTGIFALAAAGLLNGRECTTHWKYTRQLQEKFPLVKVIENRLFTCSGNIYSSAGITTGIDMALFILEQKHGAAFAFKIAREMVVYIRRDGDESQESVYLKFRQHINNGIHVVQDRIISSLQEKLSIESLAAEAATSSRNLTRLFKATTGITIGTYIEALRLEKARQLLKENNKLSTVAAQCGFSSIAGLRAVLKKNKVIVPL